MVLRIAPLLVLRIAPLFKLAGLVILLSFVALAQSWAAGNVFVVRGVTVDATGANATEARAKAVEQGAVIAAQRMLRRLAPKSHWSSLPALDRKTADNMLSGFGVDQEKVSAQRYIAKLSYSFRPDVVRGMLKRAGIPFAETAAEPTLVLPVLQSSRGTVLGNEGNFWRDAWAALDLNNSSVPLVLPFGDAEDTAYFQPVGLEKMQSSRLSRLAARYNTPKVIIALARLEAGGRMTVVVWRHSSDGTTEGPTATSFAPNDAERARGDQYLRVFAQRVARNVQDKFEEMWKTEAAIDFSTYNNLVVITTFHTLAEWRDVRAKLGKIPALADLSVRALSTRGAEIELGYHGANDKFQLALKRAGFELLQGAGGWQLVSLDEDVAAETTGMPSSGARTPAFAAP